LDAKDLVNSNGGDWGYVTLVIRKDDKDQKKWQKSFDTMREYHLIPIIRLASTSENNVWKKLETEDINSWIDFLNSLNWVIQNKYLVIGNEPNHAKEWGGEVNPEEYSDYLKLFTKKAKESDSNYFIISAGFDASASNSKDTLDEEVFIRRMIDKNPNVFNEIDGFSSHSYPNPDFSGSVSDLGRGSIKTFEWEKQLLRRLGVAKDLPIFITETGWAHDSNGKVKGYKNIENASQNLIKAMNDIWTDKNIVAITPFLLNYPQYPFDIFSWKDEKGNKYQIYDDYKNQNKQKGVPIQIIEGKILNVIYPLNISTFKPFPAIFTLQNTGQSVWNTNEFGLESEGCLKLYPNFEGNLKPYEKKSFYLKALSNKKGENLECGVYIVKSGDKISDYYVIKQNVTEEIISPLKNNSYKTIIMIEIERILINIKNKLKIK